MTIPANDLIELFQKMYSEHWPYIWGKAEEGCVDCSGAFTYAFKQFGISCPHGSNAMARRFTVGPMRPLSESKPGMVAFKVRVPGEKGYDLPDKYKSGTDLNDYYHVGLVDTDPKFVLNAKGTDYGFCRDRLGREDGWDCVAYLKYVKYNEEEKTMTATVVLPTGASGRTVNLREEPSVGKNVIAKVPVGSTVEVKQDAGQWCEIDYSGKVGWMMSNYLEYAGQDGESGDVLTEAERAAIDEALSQMEEQIETIRSTLGRG